MGKNLKNTSENTVIVEHLVKNFEVVEKKGGFLDGLKNLVSPQKKLVEALKNISFSISQGELVGFIGPNGAGKTTTLKVLSGLLYPTSGFTQVLGYAPWDRKPDYLKQISLVMGQKNQLWWDLPAIETFKLNKAIYELPDSVYKKNLEELVDLMDAKNLLYTQVRRLSLGQRMKLELIASLLHKPKILFLDEPTIGLDVVAQQKVRDFIFDYNRRYKATIILTSHNMEDLMDLAKRVIVINKGEIMFDGNLKELINEFAKEKVIKVYLSKNTDMKEVEKIGKVKRVNFPQITLSVPREATAVAASEILQNFPVADLTIEEEPVEEIIRRIFKGEISQKNTSVPS